MSENNNETTTNEGSNQLSHQTTPSMNLHDVNLNINKRDDDYDDVESVRSLLNDLLHHLLHYLIDLFDDRMKNHLVNAVNLKDLNHVLNVIYGS